VEEIGHGDLVKGDKAAVPRFCKARVARPGKHHFTVTMKVKNIKCARSTTVDRVVGQLDERLVVAQTGEFLQVIEVRSVLRRREQWLRPSPIPLVALLVLAYQGLIVGTKLRYLFLREGFVSKRDAVLLVALRLLPSLYL
jgi:hypothetical protein